MANSELCSKLIKKKLSQVKSVAVKAICPRQTQLGSGEFYFLNTSSHGGFAGGHGSKMLVTMTSTMTIKWIHQSMTKHTNSYKNNNIASPLTGCTVVFNNGARSMLVLISPFPVGSPAYTRTHRRGFWVILFNAKEEQIRQTLSPPQRPLCVVRGLGRGKNKARVGRLEGEREEERLPSFPSFHLPQGACYFSIIAFFIGIPSGSQPLLRRERQTRLWIWIIIVD